MKKMNNMGLLIAIYTAIYCFLDIIFVLILYLPYKFNLISIYTLVFGAGLMSGIVIFLLCHYGILIINVR